MASGTRKAVKVRVELGGASAPTRDATLRGLSPPEGHGRGPSAPTPSASRGFLGHSIRVKISEGLDQDVDNIVQHVGLWPSKAEFIRDAVRRYRNRWIDEARRVKEQTEGGGDPTGGRPDNPRCT